MAGNWDGPINAPAARTLIRAARLLADGFYQPLLDMNLPELQDYTPVSNAWHVTKFNEHPYGDEVLPSLVVLMSKCASK